MSASDAERLHTYINAMLNAFLVDEQVFPSAQGRMRYNPLDFQTLRYVDAHPDCRGNEVAKALGVAVTTQQSALDRLIRQGLIERRDHPEDGRAKAHRLTGQGASLRAAIKAQDMANMEFLLESLSPEEREAMLTILGKIHARISAQVKR